MATQRRNTNTNKNKKRKKNPTKAEVAKRKATRKMIIFIIILFLSIIAMLKLGIVGVTLYNLTRIFVGSLAYLFLALILLGMFVTMTRQKLIKPSKRGIFGIILGFVGLLLLFQARFDVLYGSANVWNVLSSDFKELRVTNFVGGGMMGAVLYDPAKLLFSQIGVYIIATILEASALYLIAPNFIINIGAKFENLFFNIKDHMQDRSQERKEKREIRQAEEEARALEEKIQAANEIEYDEEQEEESFEPQIQLPIFDQETGEIYEADQYQATDYQYDDNDYYDDQPKFFDDIEDDGEEVEMVFQEAPKKNDNYKLPTIDLLAKIPVKNQSNEKKIVRDNIKILEDTFKSFGIQASVESAVVGPSVTKYEIKPAVGVRVNRIANLSDDLALALAAKDVRIEAPIPGKSLIGIEVPNSQVATVGFREMWDNGKTDPNKLLDIPLGKAVDGTIKTFDLTRMPHLLVAGSTGSGKSVAVNGIITSILMKARPSEVKFLMVDPKMVELSVYNDIPHLLIPVVTNPRKASRALQKVVDEMENRYELFSQFGVRNIEGYNNKVEQYNAQSDTKYQTLPLIVVIVDELADLMMVASKEVEEAIIRLGQKARAAGIHMILATQRPSVDVISGLIKANVPSRVAFAVSSGTDSRTIIDSNGAEKLLGRGDMLFKPIDENHPLRLQGAFLSDDDVERVVNFVKDQEEVDYDESFDPGEVADTDNGSSYGGGTESGDPLFEEAKALVLETQKASASMLQRRLSTGFNRATRIMEELEAAGIIGPAEGTKPRKVLVGKDGQDIEA